MIITTPVSQTNLARLCFKNYPSLCKSNVRLPQFSLRFSTVSGPAVSEFLVHKHNFSPEGAAQVASVVTHLRNPDKSDSVLSYLKEICVSKDVVEKIVKSRPKLLTSNLEKTIKPKVKIFQDLGYPADSIAKVISNDPWILKKSLKYLVPNVEFLKSCGISLEQIIWCTYYFPRFILSNPEDMKKFVDKVDEMGVSRSSKMFIHAVRVISCMSENAWQQKLKTLRDLGFSDNDIAEKFRIAPMVFGVSEEKMKRVKELLLGTGKYEMSSIVNNPLSFMFSIERRYKPRLRVLEALESKNKINKWPGLAMLCRFSDKKFYDVYVSPYLDEVGDLYAMKSGNKK